MTETSEPTSLGALTWAEVDRMAETRTLLIPVGSTEQHGSHLPLDTDTRIAVAIASGAAERLTGTCLVSPPVTFGASGEHADFPGTLSIGSEVLTIVLVELVRSADVFGRVVFVNGHGGNQTALRAARSTLLSEGRHVETWSWSVSGGDAHAGRTETSMLLAIAPDSVRLDEAVAGRVEPVAELFDELRAHGVRAISTNGVLGDPAGATAAEGQALLAHCIDGLVSFLVQQEATAQ